MNHSLARIIIELLIQEELGEPHDSYIDWPVFQGRMPDNPERAISVTNNLGLYEGKDMRDEVVEHPGFVIMVRAVEDETAWLKMNSIKEALEAVGNDTVTVDSTDYFFQNIQLVREPLPLGRERDEQFREKRRELYSLSCRATFHQL